MLFDEKFIIRLYHCVLLLTADWLLCSVSVALSLDSTHVSHQGQYVKGTSVFNHSEFFVFISPRGGTIKQWGQCRSAVLYWAALGTVGGYQWRLPSLLMWDIKQTDQICINNSQAFHYAQSFPCFHRDYSICGS